LTDIRAENLSLAYDDEFVVRSLSWQPTPGTLTAIIGANACGKSTLLRGLARLLKPRTGTVFLDGQEIDKYPTKEVARRLGLLPQSPSTPDGILVEDLVSRGRYPHQSFLQQWSKDDEEHTELALRAAGIAGLRGRLVDELSGGQRQRVWIALALAQDTQVMLLDEPTTYLDISHQVEVLDLLEKLNREEGRTIVVVVHDINQASRYAHEVVAMRNGEIYRRGTPNDVLTEETISAVFDLRCRVIRDPVSGTPLCIPIGARHDKSRPSSHSRPS
jgi:iron complex transport system ATP-binding protein